MIKVLKEDVFNEIIRRIENGDYSIAQQMLNIISSSIQEEKEKGIYSNSVILHNRKEELIFQNLLKE